MDESGKGMKNFSSLPNLGYRLPKYTFEQGFIKLIFPLNNKTANTINIELLKELNLEELIGYEYILSADENQNM